jgi:gamma-glutamyltranspeptidase/glutathione hydrolase
VGPCARSSVPTILTVPGGRPPRAGERFVQADLGRTLTHLADEDRAARRAGRSAGLAAARKAFYQGDIAAAIARYHAARDRCRKRCKHNRRRPSPPSS